LGFLWPGLTNPVIDWGTGYILLPQKDLEIFKEKAYWFFT
jgi:hypothetical protein